MALKLRSALWAVVAGLGPVLACAADYAHEVFKDKPVAWWRFADPSSEDGSPAKDELGQHPGVYRAGVKLGTGVPGIGGKAARFNGKAACVEIPHQEGLAMNALSVEFWLKSSQAWDQPQWPGSATFVTKATLNAASSDWTVNGASGQKGQNQGRVVASSGAKGAATDTNVASTEALNDGQWHHIVWTRTAAGLCKVYVDGRAVDAADDGGGSIVNGRSLHIGGEPVLPGGAFLDGSMAEVAIYGAALSAERVRAHFVAGGGQSRPEERAAVSETMVLRSASGMTWELHRRAQGWALGTAALRGKPADEPVASGVFALRHRGTGKLLWLAASDAKRLDERSAVLQGKGNTDGVVVRFEVQVALREDAPAAAITSRWWVDRDLEGWDVCLAWHGVGAGEWRCTLYPFAGNSVAVDRQPLTYVGVPAALMFRPDLSLVALFGIDPASDYLNPTSWTGTTGFHCKDGLLAPQFRTGGGKLSVGIDYSLPLQVFLSDAGDSASAITQVVRNWVKMNRYQVQPLHVRTPDEALALYVAGRRTTSMWKPGMGYQIQDIWPVIYTAEIPISAYFDYLVYEQTGDPEWRTRAFAQMDFFLRAQRTDRNDPHFGAIETNFELGPKVFNSRDHSVTQGLRVDMNAYAARWALVMWERVKQKEELNRKEWYDASVRIADWVMKQQNPDGGLPQVIDGKNRTSVVSGRALVAFPIIHRITGDPKYGELAAQLEQFLRTHVEGRYWFTGAHPDLWPKDFEADSVWHAVEYWLHKYDRTRDKECLVRAEADAWFAFLMWCPKQLSWVTNPTQTSHAEQERYLQYSNYCYNNRKLECLHRLAELTGEPLFLDLFKQVIQCGFWAQVTEGDRKGAQYERMSDPWKGVSGDVNSKGTLYMSELSLDANLQLIELGIGRLPKLGRPQR